MTTINTIEDLIRLLREKPEWAEELRAVLLPPDVLELPALVAQLTASVNDRGPLQHSDPVSSTDTYPHAESAIPRSRRLRKPMRCRHFVRIAEGVKTRLPG